MQIHATRLQRKHDALVDALKECREMVQYTNSYENVTAIVNRALREDDNE